MKHLIDLRLVTGKEGKRLAENITSKEGENMFINQDKEVKKERNQITLHQEGKT